MMCLKIGTNSIFILFRNRTTTTTSSFLVGPNGLGLKIDKQPNPSFDSQDRSAENKNSEEL